MTKQVAYGNESARGMLEISHFLARAASDFPPADFRTSRSPTVRLAAAADRTKLPDLCHPAGLGISAEHGSPTGDRDVNANRRARAVREQTENG